MASARDIFVISDLHVGDGGARDNFEAGGKTPQLRAFLDHVGSEGGELVILGDLFELWQMNMSVLFVRRRALLDQLASLELVYVPGNHDVDLLHFIGTDFLAHPFFEKMSAPFHRDLGGKRLRFCHGHESDPFNAGDDPGFGRMLSIFAGMFEDQTGSPLFPSGERVEDVLEEFGDSMLTLWKIALATTMAQKGRAPKNELPNSAVTPAQNPDRLFEHVQGVRAQLDRNEHDAVVLGHTHKVGRIGDWYFNSGSWAGSLSSFLRVSPDGHVRYLEWKDRRAIEHELPVVLTLPGTASAAPGDKKNPFRAAVTAGRTLFPRPTKPERPRRIQLLQGALALALGFGTLTLSVGFGATAGWRLLVTAFGAYALVDGALSLLAAHYERPVKQLLYQLRGVTSMVLGLVVLRHGYSVEIFVFLAGFFAFFAGTVLLAVSHVFNKGVDSTWLRITGIGSLVGGLVLLFAPPSALLLKFMLAGWLCCYGAGELMAGLFAQRVRAPVSA